MILDNRNCFDIKNCLYFYFNITKKDYFLEFKNI